MKTFNTLLLLLVALATTATAQELKTVSRDSSSYRHIYQVLKDNKKIRQGTYQMLGGTDRRLLTSGFYKNNQRDGLWNEYDYYGNVVAEGKYAADKRSGEWSFYNAKHLLLNKFDYDKNELTYHLPLKTDSADNSAIITGTDTLLTVADRPIIYLGGNDVMLRPIIFELKYPLDARLKHITGKVLISFIVDENGNLSDYKVAQGIGGGCDEEALRVIKLIPHYWVPAKYQGKNAKAMMVVPVTYNIASSLPPGW